MVLVSCIGIDVSAADTTICIICFAFNDAVISYSQ